MESSVTAILEGTGPGLNMSVRYLSLARICYLEIGTELSKLPYNNVAMALPAISTLREFVSSP